MSMSSFGTVTQIKIVGILLSCKRLIKGINTLKQENKVNEQEVVRKKKSLVLQEEVTIPKEREELSYIFGGV